MRKALRFPFVIVLFSFLVSCAGKSPKSVAENYLKAFNHQDYEKAKDYATEDTKKLLNMFISLAALTPDSMKKNIKFDVIGEKIEGDTAYVTYKSDGSSKIQSLTLKKVEGKWKVAATKDSVNEFEGGEFMDSGATNSDSSDTDLPDDSIVE